MRRLSHHDDRGVATIFVVLMMPLLLVCAAVVFDGGRGVLARRQTQNAADAGALAKATDCAKGITTTALGPIRPMVLFSPTPRSAAGPPQGPRQSR